MSYRWDNDEIRHRLQNNASSERAERNRALDTTTAVEQARDCTHDYRPMHGGGYCRHCGNEISQEEL